MERYVALYTKYRPQVFDDIVGQEAPIAALRQSVKTGKIGHAYLFCGQRGTGKTTIARVFARAVNCQHPVNGNPCNECASCKAILDGTGMDVIEIDGASNNGVDNIRKICDEVSFAPATSRYKVYIIDEVHMISTAGFNALLKTLEEPPAHAIFIFATTELHQVPNTIVSRCLRFSFKRILPDLIASRLKIICKGEGIKADDAALLKLAMLADGALRDAITMLDQVAVINDGRNRQITVKDVEDVVGIVDTEFLYKMSTALIAGNMRDLLELCSELHRSGRDLVHFTTDLANYMRDLLIIRVLPDPTKHLAYSPDVLQQMYTVANKVSAETLTGFIKYLYDENANMRRAGAMDANFDILMIRLCGRKSKIEPVPLAMPDFAKLQAEAAKSITIPDRKVLITPSSKEDDKKESVTAGTEDPVKPEKAAEPAKAPEADSSKDTKDTIDSEVLAKVEGSTKAEGSVSSDETAKPEGASAAEEPAVIIEAADTEDQDKPVEPEEPDNLSIFDQIDKQEKKDKAEASSPLAGLSDRLNLFTAKKEDKEPAAKEGAVKAPADAAPVKEENTEPAKNPSGMAGLSDSFLDDIAAEEEPEDAKKVPEPEENTGIQRQSHIAAAYDNGGLIVQTNKQGVRTPHITTEKAAANDVWNKILAETGGTLAQALSNARLEIIGDSAYAVFENHENKLMQNLTSVPGIRDVSAAVKSRIEGVSRFFLSSESMYQNALQKDLEQKRRMEEEAKHQQIIDKAAELDIPLIFGDEK